jgi:sugar phosphate isomerase/epimerase
MRWRPCSTGPTTSAHVKDAEVERGTVFRVDLARTFGIAAANGYRGYFSIEFEGMGDPYEGTRKLIEESERLLNTGR